MDSAKVDPAEPKTDEAVAARTVVFSGNTYAIKYGDKTIEEGTFSVDAAKSPAGDRGRSRTGRRTWDACDGDRWK